MSKQDLEVFAERRAAVCAATTDAVFIVPAASLRTRSADTFYRFRQDSDFFYLTGCYEPGAVAVVVSRAQEHRFILFVAEPSDPHAELSFRGRRSLEEMAAEYGADEVRSVSHLQECLAEAIIDIQVLYFKFGADAWLDRIVNSAFEIAHQIVRRGGSVPDTVVTPGKIIHELRLAKTPYEIDKLRRSAEVTTLGHLAGLKAVRPESHEYQIQAVVEHGFMFYGAQDIAYPTMVASGENATVPHYSRNREQLRAGDCVLVDAGAELDMYACDVSRTWPINGRFTREQRLLYELTLSAQKAAIGEIRAGVSAFAFHRAAVHVITDGLIDLGLLKGTRDENLAQLKYLQFFMHFTGHWIGLDVHDVGRYRESDGKTFRKLQPGMVLTVEPAIYVPRNTPCREGFRGTGIRIEDVVLCTEGDPEILTAAVPKEVADVEALAGSSG